MIDVFPVDACMLKPTLQWTAVYKMRYMAAAELPRFADVEAERKDLVELVPRNIFSSDDGTAWAVVVVAERKTTHGSPIGSNADTKKSPASAGLRACGALFRKGWSDR
jgi:hypothetical protein